jgi:nucleotide-binding universal stress UspA family protein
MAPLGTADGNVASLALRERRQVRPQPDPVRKLWPERGSGGGVLPSGGTSAMTYKDLLVHVDDTKSCAARLRAAVDLAVAHEAHLIGVYIIADPSPAAVVGGYVPPDVLEMLQQRARERAEAALARFAEVATRNQISFETRIDRVLYTALADALASNARYADLAVVG